MTDFPDCQVGDGTPSLLQRQTTGSGFGRTELFGAGELALPRDLTWPSSRRSGDLKSSCLN